MSATIFPGQQARPDVSVGHGSLTEALGAIVAMITAEQGRHSCGSGHSRSVQTTSVLFPGQREEPE